MNENKKPTEKPMVDGKPVREFNANFKPAAYIVTSGDGVHEMTRCHYSEERGYSVAFGTDRLGGLTCIGANFIPGRGIIVSFSKNYHVFVSERDCQVTWR